MTKSSFNKLSPANQKLLREQTDIFCRKLVDASRRDNEKAYETLKRNNIKFVDMSDQDVKKFDQTSEQVWKSLTGKLYSKELLDQVLKYREEFKTSAKTKSPKK